MEWWTIFEPCAQNSDGDVYEELWSNLVTATTDRNQVVCEHREWGFLPNNLASAVYSMLIYNSLSSFLVFSLYTNWQLFLTLHYFMGMHQQIKSQRGVRDRHFRIKIMYLFCVWVEWIFFFSFPINFVEVLIFLTRPYRSLSCLDLIIAFPTQIFINVDLTLFTAVSAS